jgi:hypothetical protein
MHFTFSYFHACAVMSSHARPVQIRDDRPERETTTREQKCRSRIAQGMRGAGLGVVLWCTSS